MVNVHDKIITYIVFSGTDASGLALGTAYGLSLHQELAILVENCGSSPVEAIQAATVVKAKRYSFSDRGQIKAGLRADLVVVEGNPLDNINHTLNLRGVWNAGKLCSYFVDML